MNPAQPTQQSLGILGGTFDPVHEGHLGLARETQQRFGLDRILFVPALRSPHKAETSPAPPRHRLEMLHLALQNDRALEISEIEIRRQGLSYTIDTLISMESQFPRCELNLVLGRDNLSDLDSWKDSRKIMERYNILVGLRPGPGYPTGEEMVRGLFGGVSPYTESESKQDALEFHHLRTGRRLVIFQITPRDISSSAIRARIAGGKSVKNWLPPEVEAYIIKHQLYQAQSQPETR